MNNLDEQNSTVSTETVTETPVQPVAEPAATPESLNSAPAVDPVQPVETQVGGIVNGGVGTPKKGINWGLICVAVIVVAAIAGGIWFFLGRKDPVKVYGDVIDSGYKALSEANKSVGKAYSDIGFDKGAVKFAVSNLTIDTNLVTKEELGFDLAALKLGFESNIDLKNRIFNTLVSASDGTSKPNIKVQYQDETLFISSNMFKEVIKAELDDLNMQELETMFDTLDSVSGNITYDEKDVEQVLVSLRDALKDAINKDDIKTENAKITLDGKEQSVKKYTLTIDKKNVGDVVKALVESLADDDKMVSMIASTAGVDKSQVKELLKTVTTKDALKSISESMSDVAINIVVYAKGMANEPVGVDVVVKSGKETVLTFKATTTDKEDALTLEVEEQKISLVTTKSKDKKVSVLKYNGDEIATMTSRAWEDNKVDFDIELNVDTLNKLSGDSLPFEKAKLTVKANSETKSDSVTGDVMFKVEVDDKYLTVSADVETAQIDKVEKVSAYSATSIDYINEDRIASQILDYFKNKTGIIADAVNALASEQPVVIEDEDEEDEDEELIINEDDEEYSHCADAICPGTKDENGLVSCYYYDGSSKVDIKCKAN